MLQLKYFRACPVLVTLALGGCVGQAPGISAGGGGLPAILGDGGVAGGGVAPAPPAVAAKPVAVLLPLTGAMAPVGQALQDAARLAVASGGPVLDIRDTTSSAGGAASAAQAAVAAGDGLILGPLTSAEAHAVAPIATAAGVNVLAFTNDSSIAAPGVWALGVTPAQQVARVVQVVTAAGHTQFAALLPDDQFGHALGDALDSATAAAGAPAPRATYYAEGSFSGLNDAVKQVSDFADRGQGIEDQIKAAQDLNSAAGRQTAQDLQHQPIPPPTFNALFIGATNGDTLAEIATLLPYYSVSAPQVQIVGPAVWGRIASALAANSVYYGALFAAPDPTAAASFVAKYQAAYGAAPPAIANVAYDAAALAKVAAPAGYGSAVLTNPAGFTGTNGPLLLEPDGQVARGLAVFQVQAGGAVVTAPAPAQATPVDAGPSAAPVAAPTS